MKVDASATIHDDVMMIWFPQPPKIVIDDLEKICAKHGKVKDNDRGLVAQISSYSLESFIRSLHKENIIAVITFGRELL